MPSIRLQESIGAISVTSTTTTSLAASRINIGGLQYVTTSATVLNFAVSGSGGLDTGAIAANKLYYVHAIISNGTLALLASLSKTAPTGFSNFRWTGYVITTNGSSQIVYAGTTAGARTITTLTSGSGSYTTPTGATSLRVRMVGGGGGGGGNNSGGGGAGGTGGTTTFGISLLTCSGGASANAGAQGGLGGSATINSPAIGVAITGSSGGGSANTFNIIGAPGGVSPFGGAGQGGLTGGAGNAVAAVANTGSGGGGAQGDGSRDPGAGGGAGAVS